MRQDENKIKLTKSPDERAKVRILEEIKQRKEEKDKKQREAELEYYNKLSIEIVFYIFHHIITKYNIGAENIFQY